MEIFLIAAVAWFVSGVCGFIFWWTRDFDLDVSDAVFGAFTGLMFGPFTWALGAMIHRDGPSRVLIKRRAP